MIIAIAPLFIASIIYFFLKFFFTSTTKIEFFFINFEFAVIDFILILLFNLEKEDFFN